MKSLRQYVTEYKQNPEKIDKEILEVESGFYPNVVPKSVPKPLYYFQKNSKEPVPVFDAKVVPKRFYHRYLRTLGIEEYSNMKGDIVQLFQNTINKKRFGVIINRR